ncbi:MAG TPA: pseudouridine synthase, partial [Thermoleophilia bacterium]|nr:pseudouridine synthase [Thermoleophilia bacterium]
MGDPAQRLQKYLAQAGLGSRRHCEDLIRTGRVTVDGVVAQLGSSVDPNIQRVAVDGREIVGEPLEYWLLNKPRGSVSTAFDPQGRPTVVDSVPSRGRVFPVGRLDVNSTGLLILTNDGELTARLLHPRYHVAKEYVVTVRGLVSQTSLAALR